MSTDTVLALIIASGVCCGLIGLLAGAIAMWWLCANEIRLLALQNQELRRHG